MEKQQLLESIATRIEKCTRCDLYKSATHAVPGTGSIDSEIAFIGEAPGFYEDQKGEPFVGRAGGFLNYLLKKVGLARKGIFIGNIVKHRPPENRDPMPAEISACTYWLDQQLAILSPKLIVTLGKWSLNYFLPGKKISDVHGQPVRIKERVILPMYHPAAALRNGAVAKITEQDFLNNKELLLNPDSFKGQEENSDNGQQSLF